MGSTGSSRFTDYSGSKKTDGTGGTSGNDRCRQAFSCDLEDVAQCDFFTKTGNVPAVGTELTLVHAGRIFAATPEGVRVGALPTAYNYLAACLRDGNDYVGVVTASALAPFPQVSADFTAR